MKGKLRTVLIHSLLYIRSCFIGVLQFGILFSLLMFLNSDSNEKMIGLSVSFIAMISAPIISLPLYLVIIAIITIKKIESEKIYIIGSMIIAASLPIFIIIFGSHSEGSKLSMFVFAAILSIFGIIPGKMYYKSSKKYFADKK